MVAQLIYEGPNRRKHLPGMVDVTANDIKNMVVNYKQSFYLNF